MGSRRTKREKQIATLRRVSGPEMKYAIGDLKIKAPDIDKKAETKLDFYQPEIALPLKTIKIDLTKTVAVTILALLLQFVLFTYLQKGGWPIVLAKLQQISL